MQPYTCGIIVPRGAVWQNGYERTPDDVAVRCVEGERLAEIGDRVDRAVDYHRRGSHAQTPRERLQRRRKGRQREQPAQAQVLGVRAVDLGLRVEVLVELVTACSGPIGFEA